MSTGEASFIFFDDGNCRAAKRFDRFAGEIRWVSKSNGAKREKKKAQD